MFSLHIDTARSWRGGQNQVLLTVLGLSGVGHRTMLVAHPSGELRRRAAEGLELLPLAPSHELDLKAAWKLGRVLKRVRPDVVHAHDPHGVAMASLALSMLTPPVPPLVASRRVDFHLKRSSFSRWKHRQVHLFIAASEAIRQILLHDGVAEDDVVTVHEGIDVDRIQHLPTVNLHAALFLPHGAPIVGNVAALVSHKGQRHLIDAASLVVREMPDTRFVILGEGPLRSDLERQVRHHHLEKHVLLPGFRDDVLSCIKAFDLFVLSSETEGLGTSLLDAMAAGKACVGTAAGGIPEAVQDGVTGLVVSTHDPESLARAIVRLLKDDRLRAQMGAAGLARVTECFSVKRMVEGTIAAYSRVVVRLDRVGSG
jgi:glycosyltransferase involved in cell wall biosynthesis